MILIHFKSILEALKLRCNSLFLLFVYFVLSPLTCILNWKRLHTKTRCILFISYDVWKKRINVFISLRSYGSVFKAIHKESGQVVAIKQVPVESDLQEIIKEISIMQQCDRYEEILVLYLPSFWCILLIMYNWMFYSVIFLVFWLPIRRWG